MGEVGYARDVHLIRVSYTGELGWELHHPIGYNRHLVDTILTAGAPYGLAPVGLKALESMRLEKSYRAIHRDLGQDISSAGGGPSPVRQADQGGIHRTRCADGRGGGGFEAVPWSR